MIIPIVLIIAFIFIFIASYGTDHARLYDERWEWKYGTPKEKEKRFFVIVRKHKPKDEEPKENTTQEYQEPPKEI